MPDYFNETWFYAPLEAGQISMVLPEEEAHHALRVLRLKSGTEIWVTNGCGSIFRCSLVETKSGAMIELIQREIYEPLPPGLNLAMALLKGRDVEIPVEAACEFAVGEIFLLKSDYSGEFRGQNFDRMMERLQQKSIVALKQAKKSWLTRIHPPQDLRTWRESTKATQLILAHPGKDTVPSPLPKSINLLTGPEGGFSKKELESLFASETTYQLSLGPTRIRALHAPIAALGNLMGRS